MNREQFFKQVSEKCVSNVAYRNSNVVAKLDNEEKERIYAAYWISKNAHRNQFRNSGERYFKHPQSVAEILFDSCEQIYFKVIIVALLHDVLEDTWLPDSIIQECFGYTVFADLMLLSKFNNVLNYETMEITKVKKDYDEYWKNLATSRNACLVKLADKYHNSSTDLRPKQIVEINERLFPMLEIVGLQDHVIAQKLRKLMLSSPATNLNILIEGLEEKVKLSNSLL